MQDLIAFAAVGRRAGLCCAGVLTVLMGSAVASAQTSAFDGYETPTAAGYSAFNSTTTDTEGRTYTGYAGRGTSDLGGAPRTGSQFLFIENYNGINSSVTRTYALDPGTYSLSYYEGGRSGTLGAFTYDLVADGVVYGSFKTDSSGGAPTVLRTIPSFPVSGGGTTITFQGTGSQSDNTGFFDDLSITVVPEPTSLAALLGLGGSLLLARRRR